jgi:general secretion pathway protein C
MIIGGIIATLVAYQLAQLTWTFVPEDQPILLWKPVAANNSQSRPEINTQQLQQLYLFGKKVEKAATVKSITQQTDIEQKDIGNIPKTRLNLTLVGIVAASNSKNSSVIIEHKGSQNSYFIDSKIDDTNAVIDQIYQDRIILDVKGSLQTLMLDGVESLNKQSLNSKNNNVTQKSASRRASKKKPTTVNLDREALLSNPSKLTDFIRISPVREDGEVKGYRVKPGKDTTLFEEAGLESGDLAVELNGIDLTDTQQAITLMKEFPTMTDMTLSVERDGQLHELYLSIP